MAFLNIFASKKVFWFDLRDKSHAHHETENNTLLGKLCCYLT